eukprot:gb/GECH01009289.1/.p1 GENE.gb/GECH01009289.1/~~gb/GECH01009289.1/.p1  ORF type:complete len:460 (+),score=141.65 gb/GECH01009289.1/:1-1380(+)
MSYVDFVTPAVQHAREAAELDEQEKFQEALNKYMKSIDFFMTAMKHENQNPKKKQMLKEKCLDIMERAEQIKKFLKKEETQESNPNNATKKRGGGGKKGGKGGKSGKNDKGDKGDGDGDGNGNGDDEESEKLRGALSSAIVREKPNVKWDDVAGLENAKDALKEAVLLPMKYPQLFTGKRSPWRGILLYGPPGTGKSYLAKAVATEADATFFSVSSSDLVSKWQGESERLVKQLFEMARENKPSIVFIDEIDSLCGSRGDGEGESSRRIKTEFLVQMQGVGNDSTGVLVLGATNIPWGLDSAIRRRFERRIYIALPDAHARTQMFKIHVGSTPCSLSDADYEELGQQTDMYSGSDISILVRNALMEPVRAIQVSTHFKKVRGTSPMDSNVVEDDLWTPCSPGDEGAIEKSLRDIEPSKLTPPPVSIHDFRRALRTTRPSVSKEDLGAHEKFTRDFGSEG